MARGPLEESARGSVSRELRGSGQRRSVRDRRARFRLALATRPARRGLEMRSRDECTGRTRPQPRPAPGNGQLSRRRARVSTRSGRSRAPLSPGAGPPTARARGPSSAPSTSAPAPAPVVPSRPHQAPSGPRGSVGAAPTGCGRAPWTSGADRSGCRVGRGSRGMIGGGSSAPWELAGERPKADATPACARSVPAARTLLPLPGEFNPIPEEKQNETRSPRGRYPRASP